MTQIDLRGKVALVTGGAGGFGRAIVRAFIEHGAYVTVADIAKDSVASFTAECGDRTLGLSVDIGDPRSCAQAVQQTVDHFGGLHILINNAWLGMGAVRPDHFTRCVQIEDIDVRTWQSFMAVNASGAFYLAKVAVPIFGRQRWGRIINVTTSFFTMLRAGWSPYGPAKAALEGLVVELGGRTPGHRHHRQRHGARRSG
jgi:NAD(P)-dependent dehydrogenase (short-subunit alcohol dehydrogenase family)